MQSDNIAAYTLARSRRVDACNRLRPLRRIQKSRPVDIFVSQMNALAKQLKMERTRFVNPHGIDVNVKPLPYSTAEDLARLTRYAMNKASFRFYVSQKEAPDLVPARRPRTALSLRNTNELLGTRGIDGVKTGTTARAGECLVLSASRDSEIIKNGNTRHRLSAAHHCRSARQRESLCGRRTIGRPRLATLRPMGRGRSPCRSEKLL